MSEHKRHGIEHFLNKNYDNAIFHFSLALKEDSDNAELQTYLNLANLAKVNEKEAMMLFGFYRQNLTFEEEGFKENMEHTEEDYEQELIDEEMFIQEQNGISYDDFLTLVEQRGSFKRAFEDIMFSTRVLIAKKEDFLHFLHLLADNGFKQMALNYLENATTLFPNEPSLQDIANKVKA